MRQLVKIVKIDDVKHHPNADRLDLCMVGGWQVITRRDEFKPGDEAVFHEIDSVLPCCDPYLQFEKDFKEHVLSDDMNNKITLRGFRLKTIKLRGEVSQGLLIPLKRFTNYDEVSSKVVKYEIYRSENATGNKLSSFPSFLVKTDQERIQNLKSCFNGWLDKSVEVTIKMDGSSMTVFKNNEDFGVCSRNCLVEGDNDFSTAVNELYLTKKLNNLSTILKIPNIAIQGELMNCKIQKNREKVEGVVFKVFSVFDILKHKYLPCDESLEKAIQLSGLEYATVLFRGKLKDYAPEYETILIKASGKNFNGKSTREGIVIKSNDLSFSFKAISNQYLLENGD